MSLMEHVRTFYREETSFMEEEQKRPWATHTVQGQPVPFGSADRTVVDPLTQELETIHTIVDAIKALPIGARKRVFFYVDDLVKEGLHE